MAMTAKYINPSPQIHAVKARRQQRNVVPDFFHALDAEHVYDFIRDIRDPEHPYTLEQLRVVDADRIFVRDGGAHIRIMLKPTVPNCTLASLIGLCVRYKLLQCVSRKCKIDIGILPGSHENAEELTKQLNDKERVTAALENENLLRILDECVKHS